MLTAENISFSIGSKEILQNISLSLESGEMLGVVGPNGAGKSTLLRLLSGDVLPSHGKITLMGQSLQAWDRRDLAKRRGVLMQTSRLSFGFTVFEVVLMGRTPYNARGESVEDYEIAMEALNQVGLGHFADRLFPTLSGGEQQRVQLARILTQIWRKPSGQNGKQESHTRYLLLDEPTASLDLTYQQETLQIAKDLTQNDTAVLAILHDLNLAAQFSDRILMLKEGRTMALGTPEEVLTSTIIEALYDTPVFVLSHPRTGRPLITV